MNANGVRQNLQVISGANKGAGLDGYLRIEDPNGAGGQQFVSLAELATISEADAGRFIGWEVATLVSTNGNGADSSDSREALLYCCVHGEAARLEVPTTANGATASQRQHKERERVESCVLEPLRAHEKFLRDIGICTFLDAGAWEETGSDDKHRRYERQARLHVVAILSEDVGRQHPARAAFLRLARVGEAEIAEDGIPLSAPLFDVRSSVPDFVKTAAIQPDQIVRLADQWERCGRSYAIFAATGERARQKMAGATIDFLVPGLIPFGLVTLLAGRSESGKSTLTHELAVAAGTPHGSDHNPCEWLGIGLSGGKSDGLSVFLSGEDDINSLAVRSQILDRGCRAEHLTNWTGNKASYRALLKELAALPSLRLLVIDPVRKFTEGSEDQSDNISEFFDDLEDLAGKTGCAVVAVHHLAKNAKPRTISEVREYIRGSGVFIDRPRVLLGLIQIRGITHFGVSKHNIPFGFGMLEQPMALVRDHSTLRHLPADRVGHGAQGAAPASLANAPAQPGENRPSRLPPPDALLAALARLNSSEVAVTRTGTKSLFSRKPKELEGYSRTSIEEQLAALIDAGALNVEGGRLSVSTVVTAKPGNA